MGGSCNSELSCECYSGYTGEFCQNILSCPFNCTNHGKCKMDLTCDCFGGYSGKVSI